MYAGVRLRNLTDDLDKSSNPASPVKLSPRQNDDEESRGDRQTSAVDADKEEGPSSDEVCFTQLLRQTIEAADCIVQFCELHKYQRDTALKMGNCSNTNRTY